MEEELSEKPAKGLGPCLRDWRGIGGDETRQPQQEEVKNIALEAHTSLEQGVGNFVISAFSESFHKFQYVIVEEIKKNLQKNNNDVSSKIGRLVSKIRNLEDHNQVVRVFQTHVKNDKF